MSNFAVFIVYSWKVGFLLFCFILLLSGQGRLNLAGVLHAFVRLVNIREVRFCKETSSWDSYGH